jgi:hypothetical protein
VSEGPRYEITLEELERQARPSSEELTETIDSGGEASLDPRGPQPDRDWFAAGG